MMSHRAHGPRHPASLLAAAVVVAFTLVCSAQASAATWGELERFGEKGTGTGQLEGAEYAFGVDQSDGGLWIVDTVAEGKNFRIQKFMKSAGKYKAVASVTFKPKDPGGEEEDEVEGVAFDSTMKRAYVLVSEARPPLKKGVRIDQFDGAAAELYAFSTEPSAGKIVPAAGAGTEGLLAGAETLEPLSNSFGVSLLEPGGIAVDPVTHNVLITGFVDRGKNLPSQEGITAIEQVTAEGKLGPRWIDETDFFEECECVNSPVVTPSGHIYVLGELDEVDEIPQSLGEEPPKQVFAFDCESCTFLEQLSEFPGQNPDNGSEMSLGPEGDFYLRARIRLASEEEFFHGGVLILSPTFSELGWTGGNTPASETQACSINEALSAPVIAAGAEPETVYVLQRLKSTPRIVELGPGGSGCPKASATLPTAKSGGVEVEPFPIADKVTLSSTLTQANALSVEWEFGDGTAQTVSTREQRTTEVQHTFKKGGKLTITEKIHTDDLASPVVEVKRSVTVVALPSIGEEDATLTEGGLSVLVSGKVNPNGASAECKFEYGKASEAFPSAAPCALAHPASEEPQAVSAKISGLAKHTEYHFRISAKSAEGEITGKGVAITTGPPPLALTEAASAITQSSATLNGKVTPEGATAECHFEYGTSESYGSSVPCPVAPGGGEAAVAEPAPIGGLKAGTTYHFRIVANAAGSPSFGADRAFATEAERIPLPLGGNGGGGGAGGGVLGISTSQPPPPPPPVPVPVVTIASTSTSVSSSGAFALKITCPGSESSCSATITVQTLGAVLASGSKKKAVLMLASGHVTLTGGQSKALTLHLSSKARSLLARSHVLRARVTIVAHDPRGGAHTTIATITLRAARAHHH